MTVLEGPLRHSGQRGYPSKMRSKREGTSTLEVGMKVKSVTVLIVLCCYRCSNVYCYVERGSRNMVWKGKTVVFVFIKGTKCIVEN